MTNTKNYGLKKLEEMKFYDIKLQKNNMDEIDIGLDSLDKGKAPLDHGHNPISIGGTPIVTTHTPEGGVSGVNYGADVPGVTELYKGLELIILPHATSSNITTTLDVNQLGAYEMRFSVTVKS